MQPREYLVRDLKPVVWKKFFAFLSVVGYGKGVLIGACLDSPLNNRTQSALDS